MLDLFTTAIQLGLSTLLGGVIGLEREVNEKKQLNQKLPTALIGLRTFVLISLLGTIVGQLYSHFLVMSVIIAASFFVLLITLYILDSRNTKDPGITTELAMVYSFLIGFLIPLNFIPTQLVIALTVLVMLLLSQKQQIKKFIHHVDNYEINAFISYLVIALVILPFLPDTSYSVNDFPPLKSFLESLPVYNKAFSSLDLVNPFTLWFIVVLVTGVDLIGYILEQFIGKKKGWLLTSAVGGFVSSTATTQALARESKTSKSMNILVGSAILSNVVSFAQIFILIIAVNATYAQKLIPVILIMIITGLLGMMYFLRIKEKPSKVKHKETTKDKKIIDIAFALKFAMVYVLIGILAKIALELFGSNGLFVVIGLGSLIGLDAAILNTAQLAGNMISWETALYAFIMANAINLLAKSIYSRIFGTQQFALKFLLIMCIIICGSLLGVFVNTIFSL